MVKCWIFWHSWMNVCGFVCVSMSVSRTPIFMVIIYIIWRIMMVDINFRDMMEYLEYRLVKEHLIIMEIFDYWCSYIKYSILEDIDKYGFRININLWTLLGYSRFLICLDITLDHEMLEKNLDLSYGHRRRCNKLYVSIIASNTLVMLWYCHASGYDYIDEPF